MSKIYLAEKTELDALKDEVSQQSESIVEIRSEIYDYYEYVETKCSFGTISPTTGKDTSSGNTLYVKTTFVKVPKGTKVTVTSGHEMIVALYNTRTSSDFYKAVNYTTDDYYVDKDCYMRVAVKKDDKTVYETASVDGIVMITIPISNFKKMQDEIEAQRTYITPEMFGAVGDGVADDTVALQSMIDSGNGLNCVLKGKYLISAPLRFYGKVGIKFNGIGANSHATRLIASTSIHIIDIDGCTQISFSDIRFDYINDGHTNGAVGIYTGILDDNINEHRVNSLRIERCYFRGLYNGIKIDSGTGYTYIQDCTFANIVNAGSIAGTGIKIGQGFDREEYSVNPNYLYIFRNQFNSSTEYPFRGIEIFGGYWFEINKNDFSNFNNGEYAIGITNSTTRSSEMHIEDNYVFNSPTFLFVYTSEDKEIANFIIKNNKFLCPDGDKPMIRVTGALTETKRRIRNVVISDNNFSNTSDNNTLTYISLKYVDGYHFSNNTSYQLRKLINEDSEDRCAFYDCIKGY